MIFCAAMAGAGLAFLWFNTHPAQVFMGDVGALALGECPRHDCSNRAARNCAGHHGWNFCDGSPVGDVAGGLFQIHQEKYGEGRRILKMAPLHHHFEKSGWTETQVVVRFWIITMLLCLVGMSTLKLR